MNRDQAIRYYVAEHPFIETESPIAIEIGVTEGTQGYKSCFPGVKYLFGELPGMSGADLYFDICESIPEEYEGKCNVVVCVDTLEHVLNPFAAVKNMARLLAPGGALYLITVIEWVVHRHPIDCWRFCPDGMEHLLKEAGLRVLDIQLEEKGSCEHGRHIYACARK